MKYVAILPSGDWCVFDPNAGDTITVLAVDDKAIRDISEGDAHPRDVFGKSRVIGELTMQRPATTH
jgi:hypothetical protein